MSDFLKKPKISPYLTVFSAKETKYFPLAMTAPSFESGEGFAWFTTITGNDFSYAIGSAVISTHDNWAYVFDDQVIASHTKNQSLEHHMKELEKIQPYIEYRKTLNALETL